MKDLSKVVASIAIGVAVVEGCMCYSLYSERNLICVDNTDFVYIKQLENENQMLHKVNDSYAHIVGSCFNHDDIYFLDVVMEGDDWWTVCSFYDSIGQDFFKVANIEEYEFEEFE